jgi:hypothetical protein
VELPPWDRRKRSGDHHRRDEQPAQAPGASRVCQPLTEGSNRGPWSTDHRDGLVRAADRTDPTKAQGKRASSEA